MSIRYLAAAERPPMPWRNGGGITREIAADPPTGLFRWRMSVAEVASDGPFSAFPGYRRAFTLLSGAGVRLRVDGVTYQIDELYQPFAFSGSESTDCELLDGPVTAFNTIVAGTAQAPRVEVFRPHGTVHLDLHGTIGIVCFEGEITVQGTTAHVLRPLDAVIVVDEPGAIITAVEPAVAIRVRLPAGIAIDGAP